MADPTLQRAALKGLRSLPRPVLRLMSGGTVVYRGGRTLDPRFQFLAYQARRLPSLASLTPPEARQAMSRAIRTVSGRREAGVAVEALTVAGAQADLEARAYRPADQDPAAPILVYAHMGGGV